MKIRTFLLVVLLSGDVQFGIHRDVVLSTGGSKTPVWRVPVKFPNQPIGTLGVAQK